MKKILFLFLFLLSDTALLSANSATPLTPDDFQYCVAIEGPIKNNTLYQLRLTDDILKKSNAAYGDIRLFSQDKKEIPYGIIENEHPSEVIETYPLEIIKYTDDKASDVIDLKLPEKYQPISLIDLDIADRDFKKDIILYGSRDGKAWDLLVKEAVYDFSAQVDLRKTEITFKKADYRFYRIKLIDTQTAVDAGKAIKLKYESLDFSVNNIQDKKLRINKVVGKTGSKGDKIITYDEANFANFSITTDKDHNTVIILEAALPFDRIYFDISNPYYYRNLGLYYSDTGKDDSFRLLNRSSIYSFPLAGLMETKNYVAYTAVKHRYYKFVIENKNNPLLEIKNIKFQWVQKNLYFFALNDAEKYSLCFGNNVVNRPAYDLQSFISQDNWFKQKYETLRTTQVRQNVTYAPKLPIDKKAKLEKLILTAIVIVLVIGIGYWLYRLARKTNKQNS